MTNVNPDIKEVIRTRVATADNVGYELLITFKNNHDDLEEMVCDASTLVDAHGIVTAKFEAVKDIIVIMMGGTFSNHGFSYKSQECQRIEFSEMLYHDSE